VLTNNLTARSGKRQMTLKLIFYVQCEQRSVRMNIYWNVAGNETKDTEVITYTYVNWAT